MGGAQVKVRIRSREGSPEAVGTVSDRQPGRPQTASFEIVENLAPGHLALAHSLVKRNEHRLARFHAR